MPGRFAIALVSLALNACATTTPEHPFTSESESGLTFWSIAPLEVEKTVYAFHWRGDELDVVRSTETGLASNTVNVARCGLLASRLILLREAILESVEMVFDRKPVRPSNTITLDGPLYRITYAPDRHTTSVILEGPSTDRLTWITAALAVREQETACVENGYPR